MEEHILKYFLLVMTNMNRKKMGNVIRSFTRGIQAAQMMMQVAHSGGSMLLLFVAVIYAFYDSLVMSIVRKHCDL